MRAPLPQWLIDWRATANDYPECCHTCAHYNGSGQCLEFDRQQVPEEFANTNKACDKWEMDPPF